MTKRTVIKIMTLLLFIAFLILATTGLWMRFGGKQELLEEVHAITGMVFILLVLYHWHLFFRPFFHMWKK